MKRRAFQVILLLLLGAIVNVAMAWGSAILVAPEFHDFEEVAVITPDAGNPDFVWVDIATTRITLTNSRHTSGPLPEPLRTLPSWAIDSYASNDMEVMRHTTAWGWPMVASWFEWRINRDGTITTWGAMAVPGLQWQLGGSALQRVLPLIPIWPGFAINTIFYAAILWLLLFAANALRRTLIIRGRRRRGLCPACAYPVGTSPVCTECGNAVKAN